LRGNKMKRLLTILLLAASISFVQANLINGLPSDGLVAWFDASDLTGLSDGDPVTLWQKKAGIADVNDLEDWDVNDAFAPIYVESSPIFGDKPCVSFANPRYEDYLVSQNLIADYLSGNSLTFFIVSQGNFHGAYNASLPRLYFQGHKLTLGSATQVYCTVGYPPDATTSAIRTYTIDMPDKHANGWLDGTLEDTTDLSAMPDEDFFYSGGNGFRAGAMHAGFTAEIIIYNRELDAIELNAVGYYLAQKYSIANALDIDGFTDPGPIHTLNVSVSPSFIDTVEPMVGSYEFLDGQEVFLDADYYIACPDIYEFDSWTGDANDLTSAYTSVVMDGDKNVSANYVLSERECVSVTIETVPAGVSAVSPAIGVYQYPEGEIVSLEALESYINCPDMFNFLSWSSNVDDPASAMTTITINADTTVTATFEDIRACGDICHPYPEWDIDQDCMVNLSDLKLFVGSWLDCSDPSCD
jgi:hypothetical protein